MRKADIAKLFIASAILGLVIGLVSDVFIRAIQVASGLIWNGWVSGAQHKPLAVILISIAGGILMGVCVKFFGKNDEGIGFEAVLVAVKKDGDLGLKQIKRVVSNAYAGLVTGASIGPESPLITLGGFCGNFLAKRLNTSKQQLMAFITIALGGSMGVLVDSPVAGPILFAEQPPTQDATTNKLLVFTSMLAASVGFALYFFLGAPLLKAQKLVPDYGGFQAIHLLYGLLIGIIGAVVGLLFKALIVYFKRLSKRFDNRPILRGTIVGLLVGVCGTISSLAMFDGSAQLSRLVAHASAYSVAALLALALVRLVSTSVALGGGYQGGNIFPSIFIAGAVGLAINAMFHFIPAPVAMVACMASVMYTFMPLPLFSVFLFTEISSFSLIPVMAMSLVGAYVLSAFRHRQTTQA